MLSVLLLSVSLFAACGTQNCREDCKENLDWYAVIVSQASSDLTEEEASERLAEDCEDLPARVTCKKCTIELAQMFQEYKVTHECSCALGVPGFEDECEGWEEEKWGESMPSAKECRQCDGY